MTNRDDQIEDINQGMDVRPTDVLLAGLMVVVFAAAAFVPEWANLSLEPVRDWIRQWPREAIMVGIPLTIFVSLAAQLGWHMITGRKGGQ